MALTRTRHSLNTCGCKFIYEFDSALPLEERVVTVVDHVPCKEHPGEREEVYTKAIAENRLYNRAIGRIAESDTFAETITNKEGEQERQFKDGVRIKASFDARRRLIIELPEALKLEASKVQADLETALGNRTITVR